MKSWYDKWLSVDTITARPYYPDAMNETTALRRALEAAPCSVRSLALDAGVSPRMVAMIRDGERRMTRETRDGLLRALRRRESRCRRTAEAVDPEPRRDR